jgi:hypothetical protein
MFLRCQNCGQPIEPGNVDLICGSCESDISGLPLPQKKSGRMLLDLAAKHQELIEKPWPSDNVALEARLRYLAWLATATLAALRDEGSE